MTARNCGTCHRWGPERDEADGFRPCLWPKPPLPFWAEGVLDDRQDHDDWTEAKQGTRCATYTPKET